MISIFIFETQVLCYCVGLGKVGFLKAFPNCKGASNFYMIYNRNKGEVKIKTAKDSVKVHGNGLM